VCVCVCVCVCVYVCVCVVVCAFACEYVSCYANCVDLERGAFTNGHGDVDDGDRHGKRFQVLASKALQGRRFMHENARLGAAGNAGADLPDCARFICEVHDGDCVCLIRRHPVPRGQGSGDVGTSIPPAVGHA